jgi:hypothetical protein
MLLQQQKQRLLPQLLLPHGQQMLLLSLAQPWWLSPGLWLIVVEIYVYVYGEVRECA